MAYKIFSDESGSGEDRFEAVGTFSVVDDQVDILRGRLAAVLENNDLSHCEYKKVTGALRKKCALEILEAVHEFVVLGHAKIMVLVWDKHDSRHAICGRDDIKNLSIMYYHALKVTKRQWLDAGIDSGFHPDELTKVDFEELIRYIEGTRFKSDSSVQSIFGIEFTQAFPRIVSHSEMRSIEEPLIQAIDIVTGLVRLSYQEFSIYSDWKSGESGQGCLFAVESPSAAVSKNKAPKYELISAFDRMCKDQAMQVALNSKNGFYSHKPSNGYFFWKYEPQSDLDKAPTK